MREQPYHDLDQLPDAEDQQDRPRPQHEPNTVKHVFHQASSFCCRAGSSLSVYIQPIAARMAGTTMIRSIANAAHMSVPRLPDHAATAAALILAVVDHVMLIWLPVALLTLVHRGRRAGVAYLLHDIAYCRFRCVVHRLAVAGVDVNAWLAGVGRGVTHQFAAAGEGGVVPIIRINPRLVLHVISWHFDRCEARA